MPDKRYEFIPAQFEQGLILLKYGKLIAEKSNNNVTNSSPADTRSQRAEQALMELSSDKNGHGSFVTACEDIYPELSGIKLQKNATSCLA
jgi:hypothetical protein